MHVRLTQSDHSRWSFDPAVLGKIEATGALLFSDGEPGSPAYIQMPPDTSIADVATIGMLAHRLFALPDIPTDGLYTIDDQGGDGVKIMLPTGKP
jgi:hypothetical protein